MEVYNYFRDYNPKTGRYLQSDPIGLAGGLNTYSYANLNPLGYVDPDGRNAFAGSTANWGGAQINGNASIGLGGAGMFGPVYGSADSGIAVDTHGSLCFYSSTCTGLGWNSPLAGELGIVGSVGKGKICSGSSEATGGYYTGGIGIAGQGQVLDNGSITRGLLGVGGSPAGGSMAGVGGVKCVITYICPVESSECECNE